MSSDRDIGTILKKAKEQEKEYEWHEAAKSYEQVLNLESNTVSFVAETWERIGFCYGRASMQAKDLEEFKKLRQLAVEAYKSAAQLFEKEDSLKNQGKSAQCNAISEYVSSWLASGPSEKRKRLEECRMFGNKSLKAYENAGHELDYGKMCNDLLFCLFESLYVASDGKEMRNIAQEGIDCANKAIAVLSKLGNKSELLRAYFTASLQSWYAANISEQEEKKELMRRSLSYSEKALELSRAVDNPYYTAMSNWAAAFCTLLFTEKVESSLECAKEMLKQGMTIRDNYLKGVASYVLAFVTNWMMLREADPGKEREGHEKIIKYAEDAIRYLQLVSQDVFIAETYLFYAESYSSQAREVEVSSEEKRAILEKAVEIGRKGLEHAIRSGSPDAAVSTLHALSKALHFYSNLELGKDEKTRLLEEALIHRKEYIKIVERIFPSNDWVLGVGKNYEGLIKAELARVEADKVKKIALLENAASDMEDGVSRCKKSVSSQPVPTRVAAAGRFEDWYGGILEELYLLTQDKKILSRAIEVHEDAAKKFKKVNLPSRVAESYWKMARNQDRLDKHRKAAGNFKNAFAEYKDAAQRIPHFADFYLEYATYMKAWSEIERAKSVHKREEYNTAMKHYEKTASLLKLSKLWSYLSSNFLAWALLEQAEDLSRKERSDESIEAFNKAAELFSEAKRTLRVKSDRIENADEKDLVKRLIKTSDIRREYCLGRIALEEAKILDRKGDHAESSRKYGSAAERLQKAMDATEHESDRQELRPIVCLCQAWQMMTQAEAEASPDLYLEASQLFDQAKEYSLNEKTRVLTMGHSYFCKALEAGTRFEDTRDTTLYSAATQHLGSAANYYVRAGFKTASEYAKATQLLFDAYVYMGNAKKETDPEKKARYYMVAEKVLQASAGSYMKAKHLEKGEQVQRLLKKVREERELAVSLSEILHAPTIASTTRSFSTPTPSEGMAVGLERFERADVQANLILRVKEIRVGENLTLEIELINAGKGPAFLTKVEEIIPEGFKLIEKPEVYRVEGRYLNMKGKRLAPLETEEVKLVLRPLNKGIFHLNPRVLYLDETGKNKSHEPEPATINVSEVILPGRITMGYRDLDNVLFGGIPENYAVILTSPSCDEKESLVKRFLEAGAKNSEVTFHIVAKATESKNLAEQFQSNFYLFICNPQADRIIKDMSNVFKLKGVENLTDINIALTSAFRKLDKPLKGSRRICIEVISDILLQHHAVQTRRWLTGLLTELKSKGFTTLAVMNPEMHSPQEVHGILGLFEGEINIYEKETEKGLQKFLKVNKMTNQKYLKSELALREERLQE